MPRTNSKQPSCDRESISGVLLSSASFIKYTSGRHGALRKFFYSALVIWLVRASAGQGGVLDRWPITYGQDEDWKAGSPIAHTTPKNMVTAGRLSRLLIQALRHLGKEHITPARMEHLKRTLPARERKKLFPDLPLAPAWMHPLFRELARN